MANFAVHALTALTASVSAAAYLTASYNLPLTWGTTLGVLGFVGGLLPDIDSGESRIARTSGLLLGLSLCLATYMLTNNVIIALIAFVPLVQLTNRAVQKWTTHRGVFHSIPMGLLLSIAAYSLSDLLRFPQLFSLFCAAFLGGGYLMHLVLDEIWSLRKGVSKHCSFGTALQVFRPVFWKSFLATYALLACAIYRVPVFKELFLRSLSGFIG